MVNQGFTSLYFHFPFCETKCHYCDFYSIGKSRTAPEDPKRFARALEKEIHLMKERVAAELETIFMGGGTPSMTDPQTIEKLMAPLLKQRTLQSGYEWTMEVNPSSVDEEKLRHCRHLGVNRISMGVQSFQDHHLLKLGRVHDQKTAYAALEAVFQAGFKNASLDLICGVPELTLRELEESLGAALEFPITHLSCYLLTLPRKHWMAASLPDEDTQLEQLLFVGNFLKAKGFYQYEISNFARPGCEAKHNLCYWKRKSYLGLGPSAHSFDAIQEKRWKNFSSLHRYAAALEKNLPPVEWEETLSAAQKELEEWMLAVRLAEGFPASWLDTQMRKNHAHALRQGGLLEPHPDKKNRFRLTPRGFALSDQIVQQLCRPS